MTAFISSMLVGSERHTHIHTATDYNFMQKDNKDSLNLKLNLNLKPKADNNRKFTLRLHIL